MTECDVFIIGGGPAGSIAAKKLVDAGLDVQLVEKVPFPRFVIGESLLPRCNDLLDQAGMLEPVEAAGFQFKGGVAFQNETGDLKVIHFKNNMGQKHNSSFQVRRETFDDLLLEEAKKAGTKVTMESTVVGYDPDTNIVDVVHKDGSKEQFKARKVIDASGYGRVLPNLLDLNADTELRLRNAIFRRVENDVRHTDGTDGYIYVDIVGDNEAWIWNIPLSATVTSVGIVASDEYYQKFNMNPEQFWEHIITNDPQASVRYKDATPINDVGFIGGYSANVKTMFGKNFVMVGNATEFLDPVFSSGVTLALESGAKAAELTIAELKGEHVDWQKEYQDYMMIGVDVFREYVAAWYDGRLQGILFSKTPGAQKIEQKVVSVLSGYVWDKKNMFVTSPTAAVNATYKALTGIDPEA